MATLPPRESGPCTTPKSEQPLGAFPKTGDRRSFGQGAE